MLEQGFLYKCMIFMLFEVFLDANLYKILTTHNR